MRTRSLSSLALVTAFLATMLVGTGAQAADPCADAATKGCWSAPFSPNGEFDAAPPDTVEESLKYPAAASVVMLPSGRLVYWNGLQNLEACNYPLPSNAGACAENSKVWQLDLTGPTPLFWKADPEQPGGDDLFCSDQRLLASGTLVTAGGTNWQTEDYADLPTNGTDGPDGLAELYGSRDTHTFREGVDGEDWGQASDMKHGRWYPSLVTMPDGRLFIAGGVKKLLWNSSTLADLEGSEDTDGSAPVPMNVNETEIFNPATGTWSENPATANTSLPLYARVHLLPSGEVFYSGAGQMWGPAGEAVDQLEWNDQKAIDPATAATGGKWRKTGSLTLGARSGAFSAPLPLKPPYDQAQFLVGGGVLGTSPGTYIANNLSELVTVKDGNGDGSWESTAELTSGMNNYRWYSSAVTLPNGQVVAVNGANADEVIMPSFEQAVRQAELWDGDEWKPLSSGSRDRTYHNSAILLPDGSVLVGGHAPINNFYGGNGSTIMTNNLKDPSFERFYPPYLFNGTRPKIKASTSSAHNGGPLPFVVEAGSEPIAKMVLSRLPAATHTTDADARTVEVPFSLNGNQGAKIDVPSSTSVVPPGYYYVFALSAQGTPSHAFITKITPSS